MSWKGGHVQSGLGMFGMEWYSKRAICILLESLLVLALLQNHAASKDPRVRSVGTHAMWTTHAEPLDELVSCT